jgi:Ca2+-binding RTX toxin-like protein
MLTRLAFALLAVLTFVADTAAARSASCAGKPATVVGTGGPDRFKPASGDVIVARGGDDKFAVESRGVVICGGAGDDRVTYADTPRGPSAFLGGPGADRATPSTGDLDYAQVHLRITADGGPGDDLLVGSFASDRLAGGGGADRIVGNHNSDRIDGGPGRDRLFGNNPAVEWADGRNRVTGGPGDDRIFGGYKRDWLLGQGGDDLLQGNGGGDTGFGGRGIDECRTARTRGCEL